MPQELLHIENFAGIKNADVELGRMNIFIGPQASGKSVCAKLFFFFKDIMRRIPLNVVSEHTNLQMRADHQNTFLNYFPPSCWSKESFLLRYSCGELWLQVERKKDSTTVSILYAPHYDELLRDARYTYDQAQRIGELDGTSNAWVSSVYTKIMERINNGKAALLINRLYFIPAGRGFFSTIQNSMFRIIKNNIEIDPFFLEFGSQYEERREAFTSRSAIDSNKVVESRLSRLLYGDYQRINDKDYIVTQDGRKVALENSSSGQQEALPLAIMLAWIDGTGYGSKHSTMFIEEPEAHLYPSAQREMVHLFADAIDLTSPDSTSQYVITTHSPYVLTALNNLMYAGKIAAETPARRNAVKAILGDTTLINPADVRAYYVADGRFQSIINPETGLIEATMLDHVSDELSQEFGKLIDIEYSKEAA